MNQRFLTVDQPGEVPPLSTALTALGANQDSAVDLYPIPDGVYAIRFNVTIPQDDLVNNTDSFQVPSEPIIQGVLARAISERGEDGGRMSNDQYALYRSALG
jgi:hypothetical protein